MANRLMILIFAICIAMGVLLTAILFADQIPGAGGSPHPTIPGMLIGGDGAARLEAIGMYGFLFQALLLLLICCLCALGVSARYRSRTFYAYITACYGFMFFVWWQMYFGHQEFMATGETNYFLGFPIATAWQMYGTWLCAIPLVLIYIFGFDKYIYTEQDEAAFEALIAEKEASSGTQ
jgi:hypothetical protein